MQLAFAFDAEPEIPTEETSTDPLFQPSGRQRCSACRGRLLWWGGRLLCPNPQCTAGHR